MKHEQGKQRQIHVHLPPAVADRVETAAAREGRSLANMTRRILERWAAEHDGQSEAAA